MNQRLPSVRGVLETTAPRWLTLAATLLPDLLHCPPAPGELSSVHCLRHLSDAERDVFPVRVRTFLAGHNVTVERVAAHDLMHTVQAEQLAFVAGSGPW